MSIPQPTRTKLADGRELLFFSLPGHAPAPVADRRPLPPRNPNQTQLRFDRTTGQWVIIAALRQDRTYKPSADQCPDGRTHVTRADNGIVESSAAPALAGEPDDPSTSKAAAMAATHFVLIETPPISRRPGPFPHHGQVFLPCVASLNAMLVALSSRLVGWANDGEPC